MTIKVKPLEDAARHYDVLAARIDLAIAEAIRDGLPPILIKQRLTLAANRILSTIEEGGDAIEDASERGFSTPDTSPGVTAGAVDPAAIWAEAWNAALKAAAKACDPSSYQAHHASVRRRCQTAILALIDKEQDDG